MSRVVIECAAYERAVAILLFFYNTVVISLCSYWLIIFWRSRFLPKYKASLKPRRPIYMMISYCLILPWLFEEGIANIYLFWANCGVRNDPDPNVRKKWVLPDGSPVFFSIEVDYATHFMFWFAFWAFLQLKIFKLWMLRYDYEYSKEMSNMEWKDHLGLRTVESASFFIRYHSILGNAFLMFFLQLILLIIVIFIQIFLRLWPAFTETAKAQQYEQVAIMVIGLLEFLFIVWLMHHIRTVDDNFYLSPECKRVFFVSALGLFLWAIGLLAWEAMTDASYVWLRAGMTLLYTSWIGAYCYIETQWVVHKLDADWIALHQIHKQMMMKQMKQQKNSNKTHNLKLFDTLLFQEGFEAMMRFLVKEFSCENLLCYVELTQFMNAWKNDHKMVANADYEYQSQNALLDELDHQIFTDEQNYWNEQRSVDAFPYFENPQFNDETTHYDYIMQKYIYDSACLQINISGGLRQEAMESTAGMDTHLILRIIDTIRDELWGLMRDSFTRFRNTPEYEKLELIWHRDRKPHSPVSPAPMSQSKQSSMDV